MTCRIIGDLSEVSEHYDAVLCDVWGVFHNGIEPYPAAIEALTRYRENGGIVVLLTNAPRPAASVKRLLDQMGAPEESYDTIVSSGAACQAAVAGGAYGSNFLYVGPERDLHMLVDVGLEPADDEDAEAILITGLRDDLTEGPEDYAAEIDEWVDRGLPMLCANPDIVVDRGEMRLWCAGAIAQDYEQAGGEVVWFGKPHLPIYARCHEVLEDLAGRAIAPDRILAIGDGPSTDVPGGIAAGLDVLFVTGGLSSTEFGPDVEHPEMEPLEAFLSAEGLAPRFAIGRLR